MTSTKILMDTLRMADGGKVVCEVSVPDGRVMKSVIEQSFFEDFMGVPQPQLSAQRQERIVRDNLGYLEGEVERLWRMGQQELVVR